jgi:hypothetical protein
MSTPSGKPLSEKALRTFIRRALDRGYYRESLHAEDEHPERNISTDDVLHGLERDDWKFVRSPDYDAKHKSWEYLIGTQDLDGDELHIKLAAYPNESRIEVITRW